MDKTKLTTSTDATTNTTVTTSTSTQVDLDKIKRDIEERVNPKSINEGIGLLNNPDQLQSIIQSAFTEFEQKTGRQMSYSEMREMMG